LFIYLFICLYIVWAISPCYPSPLSLLAISLLLPPPSFPGRTCFSLFPNFVEEKVLAIIRKI
jgi:hypothetical protein